MAFVELKQRTYWRGGYISENMLVAVEDVTGVSVSRYAYEMEFMPQALVPVRITADELLEDADAYGRRLDDIDDENEEPESGGDADD